MFLLRLPLVSLLLILTFRPETRDLSRAVTRLRTQVKLEGPMKMSGWLTILIFAVVIVGWAVFSSTLGLGIVAIAGALAYPRCSAWCAGKTSTAASTGASSCSMRLPFRSASK